MAFPSRSLATDNMVFRSQSMRSRMCAEVLSRYRNLLSLFGLSGSWICSRFSSRDGGFSYRGCVWLRGPFARTSQGSDPHCTSLNNIDIKRKKNTFSNLLLICNFGIEIASIGVVHHNAQALFVHKGLFVCNDVWVSHGLQNVNL